MPFDVGCAWLHAADRNPFFPDAQAAGWTLQHHAMALDHVYFQDRRATRDEVASLIDAEARLQEAIEAHEGPDARLASLASDCHVEDAIATYNGPMDFGKDDDEISVADFSEAEDLDPNYFTREGFGALVAHWGRDVPVTLSCPVRHVRWDGPGVDVETDRGTIRAKAAIVTVSTGVLAFDGVRFDPLSPEGHQKASASGSPARRSRAGSCRRPAARASRVRRWRATWRSGCVDASEVGPAGCDAVRPRPHYAGSSAPRSSVLASTMRIGKTHGGWLCLERWRCSLPVALRRTVARR